MFNFIHESDAQKNIHPLKGYLFTFISGFALLLLFSCQQPVPSTYQDKSVSENIFLEWEVVSNQVASVPRCRNLFQIKNISSQALDDHGWAIFYNQNAGYVIPESVSGSVSIENLGGDFLRLSPVEGFELRPGEEVNIQIDHEEWIIKEDQA